MNAVPLGLIILARAKVRERCESRPRTDAVRCSGNNLEATAKSGGYLQSPSESLALAALLRTPLGTAKCDPPIIPSILGYNIDNKTVIKSRLKLFHCKTSLLPPRASSFQLRPTMITTVEARRYTAIDRRDSVEAVLALCFHCGDNAIES